MTGKIEAKLASLGIQLPEPSSPVANYVPFVVTGSLIFISGQVSAVAGTAYKGKAGKHHDADQAKEAARLACLNVVAQLKKALDGDLDRVSRCVKITGFVNCTPDFVQQPAVVNGASDLIVEIFGEAGRHARSAVGAPSLPLDMTVEIDAIFEFGGSSSSA